MGSITKKHHGRSIKRLREIQQIKQITLADILSKTLKESWDQSKVSLLEDKEEVDDNLLEIIAPALNVTPDIIRNFDPEAAMNIITNNNNGDYASSINGNHTSSNYQCDINPIDKLVEVYDENKKLYEKLLQSEKEKNALLAKTNKVLQELLKGDKRK